MLSSPSAQPGCQDVLRGIGGIADCRVQEKGVERRRKSEEEEEEESEREGENERASERSRESVSE